MWPALTEGIGLHAAAALLGGGRLAGPGRAALSPALRTTEEEREKNDFYRTEMRSALAAFQLASQMFFK